MTLTFSYGKSIWEHNLEKISLNSVIKKILCGNYDNVRKVDRPFISAGWYSGNRLLNEDFDVTNVIGFDIDKTDVNDTIKRVNNLPFTLFSFISPSGNGVKFFCLLPKEITSSTLYRYSYKSYVNWFNEEFGLKLDSSSGSRRLCFLTKDENAYINKFAFPLPEAHIEIKDVSVAVKGNIDVEDEVIDVLRDANKSYNDWFYIASSLANYENGREIFQKISTEKAFLKKFDEIQKNICEVGIGTLYYLYRKFKGEK